MGPLLIEHCTLLVAHAPNNGVRLHLIMSMKSFTLSEASPSFEVAPINADRFLQAVSRVVLLTEDSFVLAAKQSQDSEIFFATLAQTFRRNS